MLGIMRRGRVDDIRLLTADEDRALRRAFGRYGVQAARDAGARVVREHQGGFSGQWFACSCRGGALPPPVLVPVSETHIRRHVEGRGRRTQMNATGLRGQERRSVRVIGLISASTR